MDVLETGPVVVATDGTERSAGAVRYGIVEARRAGVSLRLVHVTPLVTVTGAAALQAPYVVEGLRESGRLIFEQAVRDVRALAPDLDVTGVHANGARVVEIVAAAQDGLKIVLGKETRHGLERIFTGTTSAGVAARAAVPTVVVPAEWRPTAHGRVVVGLKSSNQASGLLAHAFAAAEARGACLQVVLAWELASGYADLAESRGHLQGWREAGERELADVLRDWRQAYPAVRLETAVVHGQAAQALAAAGERADLLVVSRHPRDLGHLLHLGPTPRALLRVADVPVEVVPVAGEGAVPPLVLERAGTFDKG